MHRGTQWTTTKVSSFNTFGLIEHSVNTEWCIQLNEDANPDSSGPHWYCDAVALDFRNHVIYFVQYRTAPNYPISVSD